MLTKRFNLYKKLNPHELTPKQFIALEKEIKKPEENCFTDQFCDFLLWLKGEPSRQESFADFISRKLSKHPGAKILEVGCGRTARLSRFLSNKGFQMTCIDPNLELSSITNIKNIEGIKGFFDYKAFDLSSYDYVIGQEPCDATEHIVRACTSIDKPFIMSLCGVPHKRIDGTMPKTYNEWYDYLKSIAPDKVRIFRLELDSLFTTPLIRSFNF